MASFEDIASEPWVIVFAVLLVIIIGVFMVNFVKGLSFSVKSLVDSIVDSIRDVFGIGGTAVWHLVNPRKVL